MEKNSFDRIHDGFNFCGKMMNLEHSENHSENQVKITVIICQSTVFVLCKYEQKVFHCVNKATSISINTEIYTVNLNADFNIYIRLLVFL